MFSVHYTQSCLCFSFYIFRIKDSPDSPAPNSMNCSYISPTRTKRKDSLLYHFGPFKEFSIQLWKSLNWRSGQSDRKRDTITGRGKKYHLNTINLLFTILNCCQVSYLYIFLYTYNWFSSSPGLEDINLIFYNLMDR